MGHCHLVLLVEDDGALLDLCAMVLASVPTRVLAVEGWHAAVGVLDSGQPLCAVIADHTLRDGTGAAVIRQAREHQPGLAGLIITGHPVGIAVDEGVDVLHKPFDLGEFHRAAAEACLRGCPEAACVHDWTLAEFAEDAATVFVWRCVRCGTTTTREAVPANGTRAAFKGLGRRTGSGS